MDRSSSSSDIFFSSRSDCSFSSLARSNSTIFFSLEVRAVASLTSVVDFSFERKPIFESFSSSWASYWAFDSLPVGFVSILFFFYNYKSAPEFEFLFEFRLKSEVYNLEFFNLLFLFSYSFSFGFFVFSYIFRLFFPAGFFFYCLRSKSAFTQISGVY